jgi:hypothetical protein
MVFNIVGKYKPNTGLLIEVGETYAFSPDTEVSFTGYIK